jgi:hypothetical protein
MKITLPEQLITNTIRVEMVKQLGGLEEVARQIVIAALEEPVRDRNGRPETERRMVDGSWKYVPINRFERQVTEMIQAEAGDIFKEWLMEHKEALREALFKHLTSKKSKVLKAMCASLVGNIGLYNVRASLALDGIGEDD